MATAFEHEFVYSDSPHKISEINGFLSALNAVLRHVEKATGFNPENRFIDSVELVERISATCAELQPIFAAELKRVLQSFPKPLTLQHEEV